jgi:ATP-binding protein involved in chromosome partitioning
MKIKLPDIGKTIVVTGGKSGVGSSTLAAHLAMALGRMGHKTALADADIYRPSIPRILGIEHEKPEFTDFQGIRLMVPHFIQGIKVVSMGFLLPPDEPVLLDASVIRNLTKQLLINTHWEDTDYLIIDLPAETLEIQLTILQEFYCDGAVLVTTPDPNAIAEARKLAALLHDPGIAVPVAGIVENMAWFTPPSHPTQKHYIFGSGDCKTLAAELETELLEQIPLMENPFQQQMSRWFDTLGSSIVKKIT